jgi:adenosylhomocysteine nucleosidase
MEKLYLFALEDERAAFLSGLSSTPEKKADLFTLGSSAFAVIGVGKVYAAMHTERLIQALKPTLVINVGVAGGVVLTTNDWVLVTATLFYDVDVTAFDYEKGQYPRSLSRFLAGADALNKLISVWPSDAHHHLGVVATGDRFLTSPEPLEDFKDVPILAVDMELASVAMVCAAHAVPWLSIKTISDTVGTASQIEDFDTWVKEGLKKVAPFLEGVFLDLGI